MSELLPCPFCGGEAQVARTAAGYWAAYCEKPMCGRVGNFKTETEAIEVWNKRAERTCKRITLGLEREREVATVSWICSACGKHINKDHEYCHNCGAKVVSE